MKKVYRRYVIAKREDYVGAYLDNIAFDGDSLTLGDAGKVRAFAAMRSIDSGSPGFRWGRVTVDAVVPSDSFIKIYARASDDKQVCGLENLDSYISSGSDVKAIFGEVYGGAVSAGQDFYLNCGGRYLWLAVELLTTQKAMPELNSLTIHFESDHMSDYLPAIYRGESGDFTRRFLSVFNSLYMDMEGSISSLPSLFDYESAPEEILGRLAQWISLDSDPSCKGASPEKIREYISTAFSDDATLSTVSGIKRSVKRLCGAEPLIIEQKDVDPNDPQCRNPSLYAKLYGDNPYKFFVLLDESTFGDRSSLNSFIDDLENVIPSHTAAQVVLLKQAIQLDFHTYLGVNSRVGDFVPLAVSDNSTIDYNSMLGGNQGE